MSGWTMEKMKVLRSSWDDDDTGYDIRVKLLENDEIMPISDIFDLEEE